MTKDDYILGYDDIKEILFVEKKLPSHYRIASDVFELIYLFTDGHFSDNPVRVYYCKEKNKFFVVGENGLYKWYDDITEVFPQHPNRLEDALKKIGMLDPDKKYVFVDDEFVEIDPSFRPVPRNYGDNTDIERELYRTLDGRFIIKVIDDLTPEDYDAWYAEIDGPITFSDGTYYNPKNNYYIY